MMTDAPEIAVNPRELDPLQTVAVRLGLSRRQAMALIADGSVPAWKIGGRTLVREADMRAAVEACRVRPSAE